MTTEIVIARKISHLVTVESFDFAMGMFPFVTTKTLLRELNQPLTKPTLTPMVTYLVVEGIRDCKSEGIFLVFYTKWETLFGVRSAAGDSV